MSEDILANLQSTVDTQPKPRRPLNSFLNFCYHKRKDLHEQNPNLSNKEITQMLGDIWKKMKDDEKRPYVEKAQMEQMKFKEEYPEYHYLKPTLKKLSREKRATEINLPAFLGFEGKAMESDPTGYLQWLGAQALMQFISYASPNVFTSISNDYPSNQELSINDFHQNEQS